MIFFKKAEIGDWSVIRQIAYDTWPDTFGHIIPDSQVDYMLNLIYSEDSLKEKLSQNRHSWILAKMGVDTIGFVSHEIHYNSLPQLMIHKFYLIPVFQGLGIGTKVLDLLSKIALENNNSELRLKVFYKNVKAIGFYKSHGFKNVGTETSEIGNNYSVLDCVMVKKL